MIDTMNTIGVYEVDGSESKGLESEIPKIRVSNHSSNPELIELEIEGGKTYAVSARDLTRSITNSLNV